MHKNASKNDKKQSSKKRRDDKGTASLEGPVVSILNGLDGPSELVSKSLGEELLNWNVELLREDDCETWIDVVL